MQKDLAYLVGALRDGSVFYDKNSRNYNSIWYENNTEWLSNSIAKRIFKLFKKEPRLEEYKENYYRVILSSQKVYNLFVNDYEFIAPQEKWNTPRIIKKASQEVISNYVAGFFDAEGDCSTKNYVVGFSQKNFESLRFIKNWLNKNGIKSSNIFIADKKSGTNRFFITSKENFKKFYSLVPFEHPDKVFSIGLLLQ